MERKRKVLILNGDKWDKADLKQRISHLREKISNNNEFSKEEQDVLMNAIQKIENDEAVNCNAVRNEEGTENLIRDLLHENIDIIISKDAKTFNRIGNEDNLPILIASKCSVYSLDGKINTILDSQKSEAIMFYYMNASYRGRKNNRNKKHNLPKCEICKKQMLIADGCSIDTIIIDGKEINRIKVGDKYDVAEGINDEEFRCHDCGAKNGHYHHWGCDEERCPSCKKQLISCECKDVYIDSFENKFEALKHEKNREKINSLENQIKIIKDKIKEYEKEEETEDKIAVYIRKNSHAK